MGYTHYWYRRAKYPREKFRAVVEDFALVVAELEAAGVRIRGPTGTGEPVLGEDLVAFNGDKNCGHPKRDLTIPWPADDAHGVGTSDARVGTWYAGFLLSHRTCDGDCSYEAFYFPRILSVDEWSEDYFGYHFQFCKTAYKPYDLAVQSFLIVAKHHFGDDLLVDSDGDAQHWVEATNLVDHVLSYGSEFDIEEEKEKVERLIERSRAAEYYSTKKKRKTKTLPLDKFFNP